MMDKVKAKSFQSLSKEDLIKMKQILVQIEEDPKSFEFLDPVDFIGLGLEDYSKIITNPMDISTIKVNTFLF